MGEWTRARIQLCGHFVADFDGARIEGALPGRRGRLLFAYLVLNRGRAVPRDALLMAGWGQDAPAEARNALSVLLAAFGLVTPMIASAAMSLSSVSVIGNSLRLRGVKI